MKRSLLILASVVIAAGQICFADQASAAETNLETLLRARRDTKLETVDQLLLRLRTYADGGRSGYAGVANDPQGARAALKAVVRLQPADITPLQKTELVQSAIKITGELLIDRIRPDRAEGRFDIWGREDANGVNHTLRCDVARFASDAKRLKLIAALHQENHQSSTELLTRAQMRSLRLIARYYAFIKAYWSMTPGTQKVFDAAQQTVLTSLPADNAALVRSLQTMNLQEIAQQIPEDGRPQRLTF